MKNLIILLFIILVSFSCTNHDFEKLKNENFFLKNKLDSLGKVNLKLQQKIKKAKNYISVMEGF